MKKLFDRNNNNTCAKQKIGRNFLPIFYRNFYWNVLLLKVF